MWKARSGWIPVTHDQEEALVLGDRVAVMNAGRVVQVGSARNVYDRPATRFVAGFIGDFNLLQPAAVLALFNETTPTAWAIYPEAIDLVTAEPRAAGLSASGRVIDLRVHGPVLRYLIEEGGTVLKVDVLDRSSLPDLRPGDPIWLTLDRQTDPRHLTATLRESLQ